MTIVKQKQSHKYLQSAFGYQWGEGSREETGYPIIFTFLNTIIHQNSEKKDVSIKSDTVRQFLYTIQPHLSLVFSQRQCKKWPSRIIETEYNKTNNFRNLSDQFIISFLTEFLSTEYIVHF